MFQRKQIEKKALAVLLICLCFMLCQCYLWGAYKNIRNIRKEIKYLEKFAMTGAAQYHLTIAQNLLSAAEKQYEEADFGSAKNFARQAQAQLDRVRMLQELHERADSPKTEGNP